MPKYPVNIKKLVSILATRTYEDQFCAGVREIVANAMDYKARKVDIQIEGRDMTITNNGYPLNPKNILNYITIASDHQRDSTKRGEFGWGHLALLGLSEYSYLKTTYKGKEYVWKLESEEYHTYQAKPPSEKFGLKATYINLGIIGSIQKLKSYLRSRFSIPIYENTLRIILNGEELDSLLLKDTIVLPEIKTKYGRVRIYYTKSSIGKVYWCHKEVGVCGSSFSGFLGFINENFLKLQLSKENYIVDKKYLDTHKEIAKLLQALIPQTPYKNKIELYIKNFMKLLRKSMVGSMVEKKAEMEYSSRKKGEAHGTHSCGLSSIEKKKRQVKGIKGIIPIDKGLNYPFLWYDPSARLLLLNQTHPITRHLVERSQTKYSVGLYAGLPLNRALLCIQLFDTDKEISWLQEWITRCDKETVKRLNL